EIVGAGYDPREELRRKFWEYAMLGLYLEEIGALRDDVEALAVGAGHEEPLYWMANRVGRVVATDIYGEGGFAEREAAASMLTNRVGAGELHPATGEQWPHVLLKAQGAPWTSAFLALSKPS